MTVRSHHCAATEADILAVVVTYGDRTDLALGALRSAASEGVRRFVLVNNGGRPVTATAARNAVGMSASVDLLDLGKNSGSAGGFHAGLAHFLTTRFDLALLLDDDNVLAPGAVSSLLAGINSGFRIVCGYRVDRARQASIARGVDPRYAYPHKDAFMYFDFLDIARRRSSQLLPRDRDASALVSDATLPYAPYGGMLLRREVLSEGSLPSSDFVLYEDDTWFSLKNSPSGVRLIVSAQIGDAVENWLDHGSATGPGRLLFGSSDAMTFYAVRNRVFVEFNLLSDNKARYMFNAVIYSSVLILIAVRRQRLSRARLIFRALSAGLRSSSPSGFDNAYSLPIWRAEM